MERRLEARADAERPLPDRYSRLRAAARQPVPSRPGVGPGGGWRRAPRHPGQRPPSEFLGSFSRKYLLHPLVPELTYDDLVIVDGLVASVEIARLLFVAGKIRPEEQARLRQDLLNYCERDTWAMVKVLEKLRKLAVSTL